MAAGTTRKISAASARSHTRQPKPKTSSSSIFSGMFKKIFLVFFMGIFAWAFQATRPPPPRICGSTDGPPVTASRIKLNDGRYLAYKDYGVPKENAKHKIVFIHGINSCRHDVAAITASLSPSRNLRPGYGESDPHPSRTLKSLVIDNEELADQLGLGSKFYVIGFSMGGQIVWTCLKYIPHRLAGAVLLAPVVNYWCPGIPSNISKEAYYQQLPQDQWALRVTHYIPWLHYWWNTQKLFPFSSVIAYSTSIYSNKDIELAPKIHSIRKEFEALPRQQGDFESALHDMIIGFGNWDVDPTDLKNPFSESEGPVHLWQGDEDKLVPVKLQRYISNQLPWLQYHELSGAGHMFPFADGMSDSIMQTLLGIHRLVDHYLGFKIFSCRLNPCWSFLFCFVPLLFGQYCCMEPVVFHLNLRQAMLYPLQTLYPYFCKSCSSPACISGRSTKGFF